MANSDYDREREINEIGRDKVAANNKKHMELKKKKEGLAKKVSKKGFTKSRQSMEDDSIKENYVNRVLRGH